MSIDGKNIQELNLIDIDCDSWELDFSNIIKSINLLECRFEKIASYLYILSHVNLNSCASGMLFTNLFFRISENINDFKWAFDFIVEQKLAYDKHINIITAEDARWYISSSLNIGLFCLFLNQIPLAEKIFLGVYRKSRYISYAPMCLWNYISTILCLALIEIYKEKFDDAIPFLNEAFFNSKHALNEIYHPKNESLLTQIHDCEIVLKLGEQALIAQVALLEQKQKSRLTKQAKYTLGRNQRFTSKPVLKRYRFVKGEFLDFFKIVDNQINIKLGK
ncbi:hypothetical protein ACLKMH_09400 [Psychromonas sp. KJ10-10]|uniref:hypothetical protein n=1 Tax=Psychromonas sp. KJ10-10 TaxID=3391823 RepID=UPI0039B3EFFA